MVATLLLLLLETPAETTLEHVAGGLLDHREVELRVDVRHQS